MSQDAFTVLAHGGRDVHVAFMRMLDAPPQTSAIIILGLISLAALLLLAAGTPAVAVKDVLAIIYPPLVALAAQSDRKVRR
jgi:hypothetical protein